MFYLSLQDIEVDLDWYVPRSLYSRHNICCFARFTFLFLLESKFMFDCMKVYSMYSIHLPVWLSLILFSILAWTVCVYCC